MVSPAKIRKMILKFPLPVLSPHRPYLLLLKLKFYWNCWWRIWNKDYSFQHKLCTGSELRNTNMHIFKGRVSSKMKLSHMKSLTFRSISASIKKSKSVTVLRGKGNKEKMSLSASDCWIFAFHSGNTSDWESGERQHQRNR